MRKACIAYWQCRRAVGKTWGLECLYGLEIFYKTSLDARLLLQPNTFLTIYYVLYTVVESTITAILIIFYVTQSKSKKINYTKLSAWFRQQEEMSCQ
jgi:hypothetical protein